MRVPVLTPRGSKSKRRAFVTIFALLLFGTAVALGWSYLGGWAARQVTAMGGIATGSVSGDFEILQEEAWPRQRAARFAEPAVPTLTFHVNFKNIKKLARKRQQAIQRNFLIQEEGDYVSATVHVQNGDESSVARVRMRLKGDFTDHLKGEKWSFRVKTKGDDHILGMRVFSLQHPMVRGYAHELIFLDHMRSEGVLAPRYFFVRLIVNGNDKGIMALEEHFSKELLESQRRRDSVIVRFDETLKWRSIMMMGQEVNFTAPYPFVRPFQANKLIDNPQRRAHLDAAIGLLRSFVTDQLKPSEVFDPVLTARFLAVCEIWGARHAQAWNNMRFYYNPLTGLLEPIAFDGNLQDYAFRFIPTCLVSTYRLGDNMTSRWLEDDRIRELFLQDLKRISNTFVQESTIQGFKASELTYLQVLHQEFPLIGMMPFDYFRLRSTRLGLITEDNYKSLPLMPPNYPTLLHAFLAPTPTGHRLELFNLVPYHLEILEVEPESLRLSQKLPIVLPPTIGLMTPDGLWLDLSSAKPPADSDPETKIIVTARIRGYPHTKTKLQAAFYPEPATEPILPPGSWATLERTHPYLVRKADAVTLGPGDIKIDTPLVLPRGASLTIEPGTTLRFAPSALLIVRGSLNMPGTEKQPIRLLPSQETWRGVAVFGGGKPSVWSHVEVKNTDGLELGAWRPTGSLMFYESVVKLSNCSIQNNRSEDAINLVRSKFTLTEIEIEDTSSDAIDMDFCDGTIRGGSIRKCSGDGIDVSETVIQVHDTRFEDVQDKALSVGERSQMRVSGVSIKNCGTGLASKDASTAHIENSSMDTIKHVAIMAYIKKPEFGGARVHVKDLKIQNTKHHHVAQQGSMVEVDGRNIEAIEFDVELLYSTGYMKKK